MKYVILIFVLLVLILFYKNRFNVERFSDTLEVITTDKGTDYKGHQNKTKSGIICQNWDAQYPHKHTRTPDKYPDADLKDNFCRNPDGEDKIWCYTSDSKKKWEYCDPIDTDTNYNIEYSTNYPNNNISCGKYSTIDDIKQACLEDKECLGFSMKDGKPHCLKTKLNNKSENKDYNFYKKVPQEPDAEELVDLPSAIVLNGKLHNNILKLFWLPPSQGIKTFKYYVIVIIKEDKSSQDTETTWKDPKFIFPENNDCKLCEYEFNNLEYNTEYKYLILAVNSKGVGETSNIIKIKPNNPVDSTEVTEVIPPHIKNINCKADGTYSLDKACHNNISVESNYDNLSHDLLIKNLSRNIKNMDFDFKVI